LGSGQGDPRLAYWFTGSPRLSPDGKTAVLVYEESSETSPRTHVRSLASIGTDGTGLKKLAPLDPGLAGNREAYSPFAIIAWLRSPDGLLMWARPPKAGSGPRTVQTPYNVWRYDLASGAQIKLFESPGSVSLVPNPAENSALLITQKDQTGPIDISLLALATGTTTPIATIERPEKGALWSSIQHSAWSGDGDRVGFLIHREGHLPTPAAYSGKDRRLVMGPGIQLRESPNLSCGLAWIGDGTRLAITADQERSIYILGPDLALEKAVPVPPSVNGRFQVWPVGAAVLLTDHENEAVWRLDLMTEKWKRIW